MAYLNDPINRHPSCSSHAQELVAKLLGHNTATLHGIEAFLAYYMKQCNHALHDGGRHIFVRNHGEILEIANELMRGSSRECVRDHLRPRYAHLKSEHEETLLDSSIDLAARLVSMMDIGALQYGFSGRKQLVWSRGSLKAFVHEYFSCPVLLGQDVKLERIFNARNLDRIAGIKVEWTDNLADHLRVINDEKRVAIFHHASFLKHSQRYGCESRLQLT